MRTIATLLLALMSLSSMGCFGAALPIIARVATVVSDATAVLSIIQQATSTWFRARPDPELEAQADRLIVNAYTALRVATAAANGADGLTKEEYDEAFADFQVAYSELHTFLKDAGILNGTKLGLGTDAETDIPAPLAMQTLVK